MHKLPSLCASCRALLGSLVPIRHSTSSSFTPGKVLVVQKKSRLDYERGRGNLSDTELKSKLTEMGSDYQRLMEKHSIHHRSIDQVLTFLQSEGVPLRVRNRNEYSAGDVQWADTIFSLGGDGNFLYTASKVLTPEKLVIGLNTDPRSSEGYLCLPSSPNTSLRNTLEGIFGGRVPRAQRTRIRVCVGEKILPVRALNEVYMGETSLSQASSYELSSDDSAPERQKSSGVIIYTGTGSTSWAYNMNQLTTGQVTSLLSLAGEEGLETNSQHQHEVMERVTRRYNAGNVFQGWENKMAFVVREPIVRGLFAAVKTSGYAQMLRLRSSSWHACLIVDGDFQFELPRGSEATCSLHSQDLLTTLDTTRTNDCFS